MPNDSPRLDARRLAASTASLHCSVSTGREAETDRYQVAQCPNPSPFHPRRGDNLTAATAAENLPRNRLSRMQPRPTPRCEPPRSPLAGGPRGFDR